MQLLAAEVGRARWRLSHGALSEFLSEPHRSSVETVLQSGELITAPVTLPAPCRGNQNVSPKYGDRASMRLPCISRGRRSTVSEGKDNPKPQSPVVASGRCRWARFRRSKRRPSSGKSFGHLVRKAAIFWWQTQHPKDGSAFKVPLARHVRLHIKELTGITAMTTGSNIRPPN